MLKPINDHLLIEPLTHKNFVQSQNDVYEEIGIVIAVADSVVIPVGTKVYFDAWLCAKYPKNDTEFYWLVKYEDIRAVEYEHTLPEQ